MLDIIVIPAKAGIFASVVKDSRLRGNDNETVSACLQLSLE